MKEQFDQLSCRHTDRSSEGGTNKQASIKTDRRMDSLGLIVEFADDFKDGQTEGRNDRWVERHTYIGRITDRQ